MSKNIVSVYDTITKRYVEIEVSEKIRTYYNRTQWNIDDNNKSFYKHEIQFSALKGNINGELENFQEFRTENDDVERRVIQNIKFEKLYSCLNDVYIAPTATTARTICHTLPLTAHGHCPVKSEPA